MVGRHASNVKNHCNERHRFKCYGFGVQPNNLDLISTLVSTVQHQLV